MKDSLSPVKVICRILISALAALGFGFLMLLVFSAVSVSAKDPTAYVKPLSLLALGLASLVCGIAASVTCRKCEIASYLISTAAGAVLVVALFIFSFLLPVSGGFSFGGAVRAAVYGGVVLLSLLGSVVARPRAKKHARYSPRRRRR